MADLPPPRRSAKKAVPRIADCWFTCTNCGKKQLVASGYVGSGLLENSDRRHEVAAQMGWQHDPDLCPCCCE